KRHLRLQRPRRTHTPWSNASARTASYHLVLSREAQPSCVSWWLGEASRNWVMTPATRERQQRQGRDRRPRPLVHSTPSIHHQGEALRAAPPYSYAKFASGS